MSRKNLVLANRNRIREIAVSCNAESVALFGSTARGEDTATSDFDFVADFKPRTTLFHLARMKLQLEELLGVPLTSSRAALCPPRPPTSITSRSRSNRPAVTAWVSVEGPPSRDSTSARTVTADASAV